MGATLSGDRIALARAVDSSGYISLSDAELGGMVRVRAIGFRSVVLSGDSLRIVAASRDTIVVVLTEIAGLLGAVEVISERPVLGGARITRDVARRLPPLGEPDILRVLPLIGGVAQTNDIWPRLHLAGAAGDESLVTLDGHPLQYGLHFDGLLGAFNLAALDHADVMMHQVPAAARSRVGGVIALESRAVESQLHGDVGVSLAAASATVAAPFRGAGALVSARATWSGALLQRVLSDGPAPGFRDGLARFGMRIGGRTQATLLGLGAHNEPPTLVGGVRSGLGTDESLVGATIRTEWQGIDWTLRTSRSDFRAQPVSRGVPSGNPEAWQRWDAASLDATWRAGRRWLAVNASLDAREHRHVWSSLRVGNQLLPQFFSQRADQDLVHVAISGGGGVGRIAIDGGARLTRSNEGEWLAPQLNARWQPARQTTMGVSLSRRWQFDSQYGEPDAASQPPPVFLLSRPRRMDAAAVSLAWDGAAGVRPRDAKAEITTFVRRFGDRTVPALPTQGIGDVRLVRDSLDFRRTSGRAFGISTTLSGRSERGNSLQLAYTWQRAWQRDSVTDIRADWDIPHTLSALASVPIRKRLEVSGVVTWRSGVVATPLVGTLLLPGNDTWGFRARTGERNAARLPYYLRVDAMLRWRGRIRSTNVAMTLQLINALARENAMEYSLDVLAQLPPGVRPKPDAGVPLLPSLGFEVRW